MEGKKCRWPECSKKNTDIGICDSYYADARNIVIKDGEELEFCGEHASRLEKEGVKVWTRKELDDKKELERKNREDKNRESIDLDFINKMKGGKL